jgi:cytochrome c2
MDIAITIIQRMALKKGGMGMKLIFSYNFLKSSLSVLFLGSAILIVPVHSEESAEAAKGKELFQSKGCVACHTIGDGKLSGPDLQGVTERREEEWLKKWIKSPDTMVFSDPIAKELLAEYMVPMPNQGLTDQEVIEVISYLKYRDSKK